MRTAQKRRSLDLDASSFLAHDPKWFLRRYELNRHLCHESLQPTCAFLHPTLLTRNMSTHNLRLIASLGHRVSRIFHGLPFARFSNQQHLYVIPLQSLRLPLEPRCPWTKPHLGHLHLRLAHHPHHRRVQLVRHLLRQFLYRGLRHSKEILIVRFLEFLPSERMHHPCFNSIRLAHVPVIVKPPYHHSVLFNERPFLRPHRIAFRHPFRRIQMRIEGRLMRDHEIQALCRRTLQNIHRRHHGHCNSCYCGIRVPCFERIYRLLFPFDPDLLLYLRNHLSRSDSLFLRCSSRNGVKHDRH